MEGVILGVLAAVGLAIRFVPKLRARPRTRRGSPRPGMVFLHDLDTGRIVEIPTIELHEGMVQARIRGVEAPVWVEAARLGPGELRHPPFDEARRRRIRAIREALEEVYPLAPERWEDGFRRDHDPDREIAIWERISRVYLRATRDAGRTPGEKRDIFRLAVGCANGPRSTLLMTTRLEALSPSEAEAIADLYEADPGGTSAVSPEWP